MIRYDLFVRTAILGGPNLKAVPRTFGVGRAAGVTFVAELVGTVTIRRHDPAIRSVDLPHLVEFRRYPSCIDLEGGEW